MEPNSHQVTQIQQRYEQVLERIAKTSQSAGRGTGEVQLVVVTKTHPAETVLAAIRAGATCLGENYADEAIEKMQVLFGWGVDQKAIQWHMIGHVQSRKANLIPGHFDLIHSLDSVKLANRIHQATKTNQKLPALLQLNVSGEGSKSGLPAWEKTHQSSLSETVTQILTCSELVIRGLMTIPPYFDDPEQVRPYFRKLREWRDFLAQRFPQLDWHELSMGMSGDFEVAIQEGATLVRVGTAILGARAG